MNRILYWRFSRLQKYFTNFLSSNCMSSETCWYWPPEGSRWERQVYYF